MIGYKGFTFAAFAIQSAFRSTEGASWEWSVVVFRVMTNGLFFAVVYWVDERERLGTETGEETAPGFIE